MKEDYLERLGYSRIWMDYQILTEEELEKQIKEFETGADPHTEHYRYATFRNFLKLQSNLNDALLMRLFEIIKTDKDQGTASAMTIDILKRKDLSEKQYESVSEFLKECFGVHMQKYIDKESVYRQIQKGKD